GGFALSASYPTGAQPYSVASGDLNQDGYPDLVTVNTSLSSPSGTISVFLNKKNGTFFPAATYTVGRLPYQVAIGDVNGDGYPDLAVTNYGASTISVLINNKNGTFSPAVTYPVGGGETNPYGVVIGDFQHDGFSDIAVTAFHTNTLYVFPNNGSGAFGAPYTYATGSGPMSLVTGDFNRDGKLDLVVANATGGPAGDTDPVTSGNNVSFFAGKGDATFQLGVISPSLNFPDSIGAGDINGDGILDIVGVAPNFNAVEVTLGAGDGTFGTIQQRAAGQFAAKSQPWALALGDFNNDGKIDIVTANTFHAVNITIPAYQTRYMNQYPAVPGGSPSVDVLYNASAARIALSSSPASPLPAANTGTTVTATVSHALSGPTPTGSVIFEDGNGTQLGTGPYTLNGSGQASYSTGQLGSGQYTFTTLYSGDSNYQPTTASGSTMTITVAGTPVSLTLSSAQVVYGSTFTATATITGSGGGAGFPTGTATIFDSLGHPLGTIVLHVSGNNTTGFVILQALDPYLSVGTHQLYAVYNSTNGNYAQGTSFLQSLTVTPDPTTTTLNVCGNALFVSGCLGQVSSQYGPNPPTGNVVLTVNGIQVASGAVDGTGAFAITHTFNLGTQYNITATYQGIAEYAASTSTTYNLCEFCGFGLARTNAPNSLRLNSFTGANNRVSRSRRFVPFNRLY
ncbi:MAG: FG-GAP-like repeat-containing protein, partial [Acidobacteriaceae bacterium]